MLSGKFIRGAAMATLFLFVFFTFSANMGLAKAQEEDSLSKAQRLYQEGDYEGSIDLLSKFIQKLKAMVEQKKNVAEAFYLLAKIYFDVGDDKKVDSNLIRVFDTFPAFSKQESNFSFKERVDKARKNAKKNKGIVQAELKDYPEDNVKAKERTQQRVIEQPQPRKKKKFPILLVVGGGLVVLTVLAVLLLKKKKKDEPVPALVYDIRGQWTVDILFENDHFIFQNSYSGSLNSGTFVDHENDTGTYTVNNRVVHFEYDEYTISLDGNFDNLDAMSGSAVVANGTGSWTATRGFTNVMPRTLKRMKAGKLKTNH